MKRPSIVVLVVLSAVAAVVGARPQPAHAALKTWSAVVTNVNDGDTFEAEVAGDGVTGPVRIRMAAVQAMEVGQCHAAEAAGRLEQLLPEGSTVTLSALSGSSMSGARYLRHVSRSGVGDVGLKLIREGHAFALPHPVEKSRNTTYIRETYLASKTGIRIWDPDACGSGPQQTAKFKMWVQWDAESEDSKNLNGEYVRLKNTGSFTVDLSGWQIRDTVLSFYTFGGGTSLPAGKTLTLHVGKGSDSSLRKYWGLTRQIFNNEAGDGAYLIDPDGDIRAHFTYPCIRDVPCTDPLKGKITVSANFDAKGDDDVNPNGEWVNVTNVSGSTVNLEGYLLESAPYSYEFRPDARIKPGERMRVYVGKGSSSRLTRYWGKSRGILGNSGDNARVRTFDGILIRSFTWPCRSSCPSTPTFRIYSVRANASGNDGSNPNGEYVKIKNYGSKSGDLRDWMLEYTNRELHFRARRIVKPGEIVKVFIGKGSNTRLRVYWGYSSGILSNSGGEVRLYTPYRNVKYRGCYDWGYADC